MKQLQSTATNMDEYRKRINDLTNKNITLKHEDENISREIRGIYLHTNIHIFLIDYYYIYLLLNMQIKITIAAVQAELQTLNIDVKRLELLKQRDANAYKAVLWLKENRDKFSATVHQPMLFNINVKDASYAKYLENIIPMRDLIAFTCENKQDMNLLLKYLRDQQKLQVNVVHSDPMKKVSMQPQIPLEDIKKFGFKYYLAELIEVPPSIMNYLVAMYQLNNIPIGTNEIENNTNCIPHSLSCYFSGEYIF